MAKVTFNSDLCKGCSLCVDACPKKIIVIAKDKIDKLDEITGLNIAPTIKYLFEDVE